MGGPAERARAAAGDGDDRDADDLSVGSSRVTSCVSPLCESMTRVGAMDAAEVAMDRFAGMRKWRACRSRRAWRRLLSDQPGLADAGDDHAAGAMIKFFDRPAEFGIEPSGRPFGAWASISMICLA